MKSTPESATDPVILAPMTAEALGQIDALADRLQNAGGPIIRAMNAIGGKVELRIKALPPAAHRVLEQGTGQMLHQIYRASGYIGSHPALPETGAWGHRFAALAGGALGGFGGVSTSLVEMPATVGVFFAAMQKSAGAHGFDPTDEEIRRDCIAIFGAGGPQRADDGVDTSFIGSRMALNGASLRGLIQRVAPSLALVLGRKLASQAVPVLGAAAGAAVNMAYLNFYTETAEVRFALKALARRHGAEAVDEAFRHALTRRR